MRITKFIILSVILMMTSCMSELVQYGSSDVRDVEVELSFESFTIARSSSQAKESEIKTVQMFVVDDEGDIVEDVFSSGSLSLSFRGRVGQNYRLYVFANNGSRIIGMDNEKSILDWEYATEQPVLFPCGLPMVGIKQIRVEQGKSGVAIELERLVSRVELKLSGELISSHGQFTLNSVKLRNCVKRLKPFLPGQKALKAEDVGDGDIASPSDIQKLNANESIVFYTLENMQGNLLPSNSDPWEKIPSKISGKENLCTYLEAEGTYYSSHYGGSNTYRMYLGSDNISNFDLRRNNFYRLTLSPTETNMRKLGNWKITSSDWTDSRSIKFSQTSMNLYPGSAGRITLKRTPSDLDVTLSDSGFAEAGLRYETNGDYIDVFSSSASETGKEAVLYAKSWDGRIEDSFKITIGPQYEFSGRIDMYPREATIKPGESIQLQAIFTLTRTEYGKEPEEIYSQDITHNSQTQWRVDKEPKCISVEGGRVTGLYEGKTIAVVIFSGAVNGTPITVKE